MRTLVSVDYGSPLTVPPGVDVDVRPSDWGLAGARKNLVLLWRGLRLAMRARRYDRVVIVTAGVELFVLASVLRRPEIVAADWLMPQSRALDRLSLRRVRFCVIRRADAATLASRFGVRDATFVPFPAPARSGDVTDEGYVYSAGQAHRDWPTLLRALAATETPAVISAGRDDLDPPPRVRVLAQQSSEEGRRYLRACRAVALAFEDTDLPSGPLVLLDAMAHGKAVVVSDVAGSRDYVEHDVNALVVPPGDAEILAEAIARVYDDRRLRERLGAAAAQTARELTSERFWQAVLSD